MDRPVIETVRFRGSQVVEVLRTEVLEGDGVPGDPCRTVTYYSDLEGRVLAVVEDDCMKTGGITLQKTRRFVGLQQEWEKAFED